jgi:hypothetical protein
VRRRGSGSGSGSRAAVVEAGAVVDAIISISYAFYSLYY